MSYSPEPYTRNKIKIKAELDLQSDLCPRI